MDNKKILITGGAGFIGSAVIRFILDKTDHKVINFDKLTYAGNLETLSNINHNPNYFFEKIDVCNMIKVRKLFFKYKPDLVIHLAAETHVDRSIDSPIKFVRTNVLGTYVMLEECRNYWKTLIDKKRKNFRFLHVSSDEVYGDLKKDEKPFTENSKYFPSSPYSASKAGADHLVRAWYRTFNFPTMITNCSNNYGPYQFPEKFIPLLILNALKGKSLPIYGNGKQVRDWLYVEDHASAILKVALNGKINETYNIGGNNEFQNIEVAKMICKTLDKLIPCKNMRFKTYEQLITHVKDRPGHDKRYAINSSKIRKELNWSPNYTFKKGLKKTIEWYLANYKWHNKIKKINYKKRIGINF